MGGSQQKRIERREVIIVRQILSVLMETCCPDLKLFSRGKVRDVYDLGAHLLLVATDRLSAFDVVSSDPIPGKGQVLTLLSAFWFNWITKNMPWFKTHFITCDWNKICELHPELVPYSDQLAGRSTLVYKLDYMFSIEIIIRLFLFGSVWKEYQKTGRVCGMEMPLGMLQAQKIDFPLVTPSTKAQSGHDENISVEEAIKRGLVTEAQMREICCNALLLSFGASRHCETRKVILCDHKLEFGMLGGEIRLGDEVLTPDSSRFWPADQYQVGRDQPSFDKQFVRVWLEDQGWNKVAPMPRLPEGVISGTTDRYFEALERLTDNAGSWSTTDMALSK